MCVFVLAQWYPDRLVLCSVHPPPFTHRLLRWTQTPCDPEQNIHSEQVPAKFEITVLCHTTDIFSLLTCLANKEHFTFCCPDFTFFFLLTDWSIQMSFVPHMSQLWLQQRIIYIFDNVFTFYTKGKQFSTK